MDATTARAELKLALQRRGFHRNPRAKDAWEYAGHPGNQKPGRVDFQGKSVRYEMKHEGPGGTWFGVSDTFYFGQLKKQTQIEQLADHFTGMATGKRAPAPTKIPLSDKAKASKVRAADKARGPAGFYVTNVNARSSSFSSKTRVAEVGPFRSLDEALEPAWRKYQDFVQMKFDYLLPVQIVEVMSREEAEHGGGYVWWTNGKRRNAPAHPRQTAFANFAGAWADSIAARHRAGGSLGTRSRPMPIIRTFREIPIGSQFTFEEAWRAWSKGERGAHPHVYSKVGPRTYVLTSEMRGSDIAPHTHDIGDTSTSVVRGGY